jgi:uncharacterized protein (DUF952 family)
MSKNIDQVNRVKNKYHKDASIVLVHIDGTKIPNLKYEENSNGYTHPHLYEELNIDHVIEHIYILFFMKTKVHILY